MDPILRLFVRAIQPGRGPAWHGGPTPVTVVRGVSARLARWRPARGRHSIWELTLHNAYWNHTVRRRILGAALPRFPRSPANWPAMPAPANEAAWKLDRELLADEHQLLAETIADFPAALLGRSAGGKKRWTWGDVIIGIAMHDAYHAGQVQLLKRLGSRR